MNRLDSLPLSELNKLYRKSLLLILLGILFIAFSLISIPSFIDGTIDNFKQGRPFLFHVGYIAGLLGSFSIGYLMIFGRMRKTRYFIYVWSIVGFSLTVIVGCITVVKFSSDLRMCIWIIALLLILVLIMIGVFAAARSDYLFGRDSFTHRQIALARKYKRNNREFSDEQLLRSVPNSFVVTICIIFAYLFEFFFVVATIMLVTWMISPK